jgi:hypothetical protein
MPDILDFDPTVQERWTMRYEDGTVRREQYRNDLIHTSRDIQVTPAAAAAWGIRCPYPLAPEETTP